MLPLAKQRKNHTKNKHFVTYANNNFMKSLLKIKTTVRSGIIVIIQGNVRVGAAHSICNLRCQTPKEIPIVFHNGSYYC